MFLLLVFLLGCNSDKIERYNIQPILESKAILARKTDGIVKLELCSVNSFNWDKIIVVPPYSTAATIAKYNLHNSRFVEVNLLDTLYHETHNLLLFVKQNAIMRYSYVPRETIDFAYVNDKSAPLTISRKIACEQLYIKSNNMNLKLYY